MSYAYSSYIACPNIQDELNTQFLNNTQNTVWPNGTLQLITSDLNTDGTLQRAVSENGKIKTVELRYQPRFTDASSNSATINCSGGDEYGDTSTTYQVDTSVGKSRSWKITPKELAARCEEDAAWVSKQLMRHMTAIEHDMDIEAAQFVAANLGDFYDSSTKNVNVQTFTSTSTYSQFALGDILYETQRLQWPGRFFLIGDGLITKYMNATDAGCCALQGVDLGMFAQMHQFPLLRDPEIPTALGNQDAFVAIGAGAVQMISYNEFASDISRINDEGLKVGTIVNPFSNIEYDYYAKYDCGVWNFQIKLAYKFVTLPSDAYRINDPLEGTNGILQFTVVNP